MLICILPGIFSRANAQYFDLEKHTKHVTIPFRLIRNMIIIKIKINNEGPFNFILDTGVGLMIITEPKLIDSINLSSKTVIKIPGLGEGTDNEAYLTPVLDIGIPGMESHEINAAILKTDQFNLSNFAGIPIYGLLGYDFFSNLAIKVNFADSTIIACRPADLRHLNKFTQMPISIEERKPYLHANITFPNGKTVDSKLVIDIGAGHPISIENMIKNNGLPQKSVAASLGIGLNGPIEGYLSRVNGG